MKEGKILIVEDDTDVSYTASLILRETFADVRRIAHPDMLMDEMHEDAADVVLLDMNFMRGATSGKEGLRWLAELKRAFPYVQVVLNTAYGDISLAVEGMKRGATDFLVKPWEAEKLLATVMSAYRLSRSCHTIDNLQSQRKSLINSLNESAQQIISRDAAMQPVFETIRKVAATDANVLILGENGTGKELVARELHRQSGHSGGPFIKVDLGAIAESLFESELFGHRKGAFTDAKEDRSGRFVAAQGGTLFLDEIGNLPLSLQAKILTALQSRSVTPVGSASSVQVDVRLICATNRDLYDMVQSGTFREDLLYRINTVEIGVPPLRSRKNDIAMLARYFLQRYARKYGKESLKFDKEALLQLRGYHWPGNVRELQHAVERAVIMADGDLLSTDDFGWMNQKKKSPEKEPGSLKVESMEREIIESAIRKNHGNLTKAADELGIGRSTLYRKIKKYGI